VFSERISPLGEGRDQVHADIAVQSAWPTTGRGRRLYDLRHTAARVWLAAGVPASTVQAWLGHSSLQTTQIYVHYLGDSADQAGLEVLNRRGSAGGARPDSSNPNFP
jgi:integrase